MIRRLFDALRLRFGLRHDTACRPSKRWPCAVRIRRRTPYGPRSAFTVVKRDGFQMIEPRASR